MRSCGTATIAPPPSADAESVAGSPVLRCGGLKLWSILVRQGFGRIDLWGIK
ncbi:hypothetical protein [Gilliamella sp. BG6]|uniref:hypothetical protein n=1 Tax=unclassified Gilliamella TaxID=2685620 RepID=UPI003986AA61|nr:hypothetical protein [Gilliamella sp.]